MTTKRRLTPILAVILSIACAATGLAFKRSVSAQSSAVFQVSAPAAVAPGELFTITVTGVPAGRFAAISSQAGTLGWPQANAQGIATLQTQTWANPTVITVQVDGTGPSKSATIAVGTPAFTTTTAATTTTIAPSTTAPPTTGVRKAPNLGLFLDFPPTGPPRYFVNAVDANGQADPTFPQADIKITRTETSPGLTTLTAAFGGNAQWLPATFVHEIRIPKPTLAAPRNVAAGTELAITLSDPVTNQPLTQGRRAFSVQVFDSSGHMMNPPKPGDPPFLALSEGTATAFLYIPILAPGTYRADINTFDLNAAPARVGLGEPRTTSITSTIGTPPPTTTPPTTTPPPPTTTTAPPSPSFTINAPTQVAPGEAFTITVSGVPAGRWAAIESQDGTLGWAQADAQGIATLRTQTWRNPTILSVRIDGVGPAKTFTINVGTTTTSLTTKPPTTTMPPTTSTKPPTTSTKPPTTTTPTTTTTTTTSPPTKPKVTLSLTSAQPAIYNFVPQEFVVATLPDGSQVNLASTEYDLQTVEIRPYVRRVTLTLRPTSKYRADPLVRELKAARPNIEVIPTPPYLPTRIRLFYTDPDTNEPINGFGRLYFPGIAALEWVLLAGQQQIIDLRAPTGDLLRGTLTFNVVTVGYSGVPTLEATYSQGFVTENFQVQGPPPFLLRAVDPPTTVKAGQLFTLRFAGAPVGTWVAVTYLSPSTQTRETLGWAPVAKDGTASLTIALWEKGNLELWARLDDQGELHAVPILVT